MAAGRPRRAHVVRAGDQRALEELLRDGRLAQRVANRARALLALGRGEAPGVIGQWTGLSRMGLWHLWERCTAGGARRSSTPSAAAARQFFSAS
jgi:hypothetical protein